MPRAIVTPPVLAPTALAALKQWLAIATDRDDLSLTDLLRASLDMCEAFTGTMPLVATCEEVLPALAGWQTLATRPVQAIGAVAALDAAGARALLDPSAYAAAIAADGSGQVSIAAPSGAQRFVVTFTAGLAIGWDDLPDALRHGMIRLAAHQHRERDGSGAGPLPPASVAALWRPWRRLRLA